MLSTNSLINPQFQIEPIQVALSDTSGIAQFSFFDYDLVSRLGDHKNNYADAQVTYVRVETLDSYVEQFHLPPPDFVKIDVEGSELLVLHGMQKILASKHPTLLIEVHRPEDSDETAADYGDQVVDFLSARGYCCSFIQHQVPRQVLCTGS
jgi:FkbM family methyltransferase